MIVYIENPSLHAGRWIYKGYQSAWEEAGYEVRHLPCLSTSSNSMLSLDYPPPGEYMLMALAIRFNCPESHELLENSHKAFLYTAPTSFPGHWGTHPNYIFNASPKARDLLNKSEKQNYGVLLTPMEIIGMTGSLWRLYPLRSIQLIISRVSRLNTKNLIFLLLVGGQTTASMKKKNHIRNFCSVQRFGT